MTQESLDFGRAERVVRTSDRLRRELANAVDAIGLLQAAGACDARRSELHDALNGRDGRYVRLEWIVAILDVAPPDYRLRIFTALADPHGLEMRPVKPMTDAERATALEAFVRAMPLGEQLLEQALGGRR